MTLYTINQKFRSIPTGDAAPNELAPMVMGCMARCPMTRRSPPTAC